MKGKLFIILIGLLVLAGGLYLYATKPAPAPSNDIAVEQTLEQVKDSDMEVDDEESEVEEGEKEDSVEADATAEVVEEVVLPSQQTPPQTAEHASANYLVTQGTLATYIVNEVLRGSPNTVVGKTDNVSGSVQFFHNDISSSKIAQVRINARTFKTDSGSRDNAVVGLIFKSHKPENEFITYKPDTVQAEKNSLAEGESTKVTFVGTLTISGKSRKAVFAGSIKRDTASTLSVQASSVVRYADYGLSVPDLSFLADVDEEVTLKINLIAKK